jgi:hypothetical protein
MGTEGGMNAKEDEQKEEKGTRTQMSYLDWHRSAEQRRQSPGFEVWVL